MKFILTTISALLIIEAANGQGIAASIRSGIGGNKDIANMKSEGVKQSYWNKQILAGTKQRKGWRLNYLLLSIITIITRRPDSLNTICLLRMRY